MKFKLHLLVALGILLNATAAKSDDDILGLPSFNIKLEESTIVNSKVDNTLIQNNKQTNVITPSDLSNKGYTSFISALDSLPFINPISSVDGSGTLIDMRGQGLYASSRVKFIVDDIPLNILDASHTASPIDIFSLNSVSRVEVLPGFGSVLYGNNASAGVVKVTTKLGNNEDYTHFQTLYKSFDDQSLSAGIGFNLPYGTYIAVNNDMRDSKGYRDRDEKETNSFNFKASQRIGDNHSIALHADYYNELGVYSNGLTKEQLEKDRTQAGSVVNANTDKTARMLIQKSNFGNLSVENKLYNQEINLGQVGEGAFAVQSNSEDVKNGFSNKNEYNYGTGKIVMGYEYLDNKLERDSKTVTPTPFFNIDTFNDLSKVSNSMFFNNYLYFSNFTLGTGYRYEGSNYNVYRIDRQSKQEIDFHKTRADHAYNVTLSYDFMNNSTVYTTFEKGYITPSPTQLVDKDREKGYLLNDLDGQDSYSFDVGYKGRLLSSYFATSVFYTIVDNEISQESIGHDAWKFYNVDQTSRLGLEVFAEQYVGKWLFNQSLSLISSKITEGEFEGERIAQVPNYKATASVGYELTEHLTTFLKSRYIGGYKIANGLSEASDPYLLFDASGTYKINDDMYVTGGVDNILNEEYNTAEALMPSGVTLYTPAAGRTYYVSFKYEV